MSLFGYPASVIHYKAVVDEWKLVSSYQTIEKAAKVVEELKLIKNSKGEEVQSIGEIHLEGFHEVSDKDYFLYINAAKKEVRYDVKHIEYKKQLGTDQIKKVIVYG